MDWTESDIDGDTTLTLSLQLVENPNVHERSLTGLGGLLLELFIDFLVIGGCRFARVDVTVNNDIDLNLFLGHRELSLLYTNTLAGDVMRGRVIFVDRAEG